MGGFLGIGGRQAQDYNQVTKGYGELGNAFNFGINRAQGLSSSGDLATQQGVTAANKGIRDTSSTLDYWKGLASGNRTAALQTVAPETNSLQQQTDAARRQQSSMGTARGGGVAPANVNAQQDMMGKIDNLLFGTRPVANQQVSQVGQAETGEALGLGQLGTTQTGQGIQSNQVAAGSAAELTDLANKARANSYNIARSQTQDVLNMIHGGISGLKG